MALGESVSIATTSGAPGPDSGTWDSAAASTEVIARIGDSGHFLRSAGRSVQFFPLPGDPVKTSEHRKFDVKTIVIN
jgi:hypothetical protein